MERMFLKPAILRYIFKSEDSSHTVRHSSPTLHSEEGFSPCFPSRVEISPLEWLASTTSCVCLAWLQKRQWGEARSQKKRKDGNRILYWDRYKDTLQGWYVCKSGCDDVTREEPQQTSLLGPHTKLPPSSVLRVVKVLDCFWTTTDVVSTLFFHSIRLNLCSEFLATQKCK